MTPYHGPDLLMVVLIAVQVGGGLYLVLERSLTRIALGVVLAGNGVNLLFIVVSGPAGSPPLANTAGSGEMADPLPQALVLTAIVITLAVAAFLVTMAYRSWQLHQHDEVQDDLEDRRIARMATMDLELAEGDRRPLAGLEDIAASVRDETASFVDENWVAEDTQEQ